MSWPGQFGIAKKHGHRTGRQSTPTYRAWHSMLCRCYQPAQRSWKLYGGRGIVVCDRWRDFKNFLADMGEKPLGLTLDRLDNDGNYEPSNCRWATALEQVRNRRCNKLSVEKAATIRRLHAGGATTKQLAEMMGAHENTIGAVLRGKSWMPPA